MEQTAPRASLHYRTPVTSHHARALMESAAQSGQLPAGRGSAAPSRLHRLALSGLSYGGGVPGGGGFYRLGLGLGRGDLRKALGYLGDAASDAAIFQQGAGLATPVVTAVIGHAAATAAAASGQAASILGMGLSTAIPIIGAALAGVAMGVAYLIKNSGCGITCVETSQWANQAEPYLKQNADAYFALPAPRDTNAQTAALNVFDTVWARLQQLCGQPGTGNAGVRCISDRQSGACTWHATGTPPWPGSPAVGSCWNWFNAYRDPIAQDPVVSPASLASSLSGGAGGTGAAGSGGGISSLLDSKTLLLIGGALLLVGAMGD